MIDVEALGAATLGAVPFLRTLGVEFVAVAVEVTREDGTVTTEVRVVWTPRPL